MILLLDGGCLATPSSRSTSTRWGDLSAADVMTPPLCAEIVATGPPRPTKQRYRQDTESSTSETVPIDDETRQEHATLMGLPMRVACSCNAPVTPVVCERVFHFHAIILAVPDGKHEPSHSAVGYPNRYIPVDNRRRRKRHERLQLGVLTQDDLKRAEELLWKVAQKEVFAEELSILAKTQEPPEKRHCIVSRSSAIYKTWPFMDERGILMIGRISMAPYIPKEPKFPAILRRKYPTTFLVIDWYPRRFNHAHRVTIMNEIRQRFEIPKLRSMVEKVTKNCVPCRINKAALNPPPTASLPAVRLTSFLRPFSFVGLDHSGPVFVRVNRSLAKRWIALFTCLTVRAVHMEVVHSLSTVSCIMAVRRFVPGCQQRAQGGNCQSVKVLDATRKLDDETLETVILEAVAMINSEPLTFVTMETADQKDLFNHFLLGGSTGVKTLLGRH
ncbi:uncharacterized protein LOC129766268 [Toxorhynchites rutilus septentrionalis]|uniref:uncharacterized protein LOC129766268 n=1 Tax=Toxorhynchites rutilus septentrionalis TaxID=329112 RepID=UPI00247AC3DC|nr:uncharacterized protein LOC129766268 [Toxorhynchites rutilus septentrionalis]